MTSPLYDRIVEVDILVEEKGFITNIQDYVVHDGPGLRVLVFFKGCPLRCKWCQNPENLNPFPEIMYRPSLCVESGRCREVCPVGAITEDKEHRIDRSKCTRCMYCVDVCLGRALIRVGEWVSVEQLLEQVVKYNPFFSGSDHGGVTLSGGEPAFQPEFALQFLKSLRKLGIHTAFETCGYADYEALKRMAQNTDLVIYDIKHMNEASHIIGTGRSNSLILENLSRLCQEVDTEIIVHLPLICGFNDDDENIRKSAGFVSSLKKIRHVDLLPFNYLASGKYKGMGLEWEYAGAKQQSEERLARLKGIVQSYGLEVVVGGLW